MAAVFETVLFAGGGGDLEGGFLFGEAYDDASGRPSKGSRSRSTAPAACSPAPSPPAARARRWRPRSPEGRGRFTMAGEVAAGRYAIVYRKDGYTGVVRRLALRPAVGSVPFYSRLTPRAGVAGAPIRWPAARFQKASSPSRPTPRPCPAALPSTPA